MGKLPGAPLVEVIFELRWPINTQEALDKYTYIPGELYGVLKNTYPYRETLMTALIPPGQSANLIAHRFRIDKESHPLVQVGPGILTVNTTEKSYEWYDFEKRIQDVIKNFFTIYPFELNTRLSLNLLYIDFIPFDFHTHDVLTFLKSKMHISLNQSFFSSEHSPNGIQLALQYQTDSGVFSLNIQSATHQQKQGLMIHFSVSNQVSAGVSHITDWLDNAHNVCSQAFKNLTNGDLYQTFNQPHI